MEHQHLLRSHISGLWDITTFIFNILSEKTEPLNMGTVESYLLLGNDYQLCILSHECYIYAYFFLSLVVVVGNLGCKRQGCC